jgi:MFS transporter, FHS family, L-fucose permease
MKIFSALKFFRKRLHPIIIIGVLFFIFGFITWANSVLIPYLKISCELSNFHAYLVAFAFYIAYFVMAIPSGWLLKRIGFKNGMAVGLIVISIGALLFVPAAYYRTFPLFLTGLFVQGTGLALLQTASNPYVIIIGPQETAAKRISIMGICNKVAGGLAPIVVGGIALKNADNIKIRISTLDKLHRQIELDQLALKVVLPYIIIVGILILLAILVYYSRLPDISLANDSKQERFDEKKKSILQFPHLFLGAFSLFSYVGTEVIAGDTIINYASSLGIPFSLSKFFTTCTLVAMIVGYIIGIAIIPKYLTHVKALKISSILGLFFSVGVIVSNGIVSVCFIAFLGLANALIWPSIWPLALSKLGRHTTLGSSFLIMSIAGGAIIPLIYGKLVDMFNAQIAYVILFPCYAVILFYSLSGYKMKGNLAPAVIKDGAENSLIKSA